MKKTLTIIIVALTICSLNSLAFSGKDKPITFAQLPAAAQQLIRTHFPKSKVALAKMEKDMFGKSYEVIFTNGNKLEFDSDGRWTCLDCEYTQVPIALVPQPIIKFVKAKFPNTKIVEIERNRKGYHVDLSNKVDIKFNTHFQVTKID